ncbi:acylphosphatase [candidate division KSB3 bacterium]|uniref:acylphosphatase n=1 Tax=candidate division KSB3 bacterium TaxID=2044937 RepID=A0A2G6E7H1_9BACT|nr:MAG: acylphosphatase [candidate division KSB3 bacterium]PIE30303.1 MAG: acylphosphatase [candidate division KSB3 bacterium]
MSRHLYVTGLVQGVAFRYSALRQAKSLQLSGWVRNVPDERRVELIVEGEEDAVERMIDWCRQGPPSARVTNISIEALPYSGSYQAFHVKF